MGSVRVLILAGALVGCGDNLVEPVEPIVCGGLDGRCVDARFVAHEDDDLLFMNPDVAASIANGNDVVTVFLTAGTNTDLAYMTARETGILDAYAYMIAPDYAVTERDDGAEMLAHWALHAGEPLTLGSHRAIQYDFVDPLPAGGRVSIVFLRLVEINGVADLATLWREQSSAIATVPCMTDCVHGSSLDTQSYSEDELIDALELVMTQFEAAGPGGLVVSTLDGTQLFHRDEIYGDGWVDNSDHVAAAELVLTAFTRHHRHPSATPRPLLQYRGYDIAREPANLGAQTLEKRRAFYRYHRLGEASEGLDSNGHLVEYTNANPDDPQFTERTYQEWTQRRYVVTSEASVQGQLAIDADHCLIANGPTLALGPCASAPTWTLTDNDELRGPGASSCIVLGIDTDLASLAPCGPPADAERQTFLVTGSGQIRGRRASCLEADLDGVRASACDQQVDGNGDPIGRPVPAQAWTWR